MADPTAEALKAHLDAKWVSTACPICEGVEWHVAPEHYVLVRRDGLSVGGLAGVPLGLVLCVSCGYVYLMCLEAAGIRGDSDE